MLSTILLETEKAPNCKKSLKKEKFEKRAVEYLNFSQKDDFSQKGAIKRAVLENFSQFLICQDENGVTRDSPYGSLLKLCGSDDKSIKMTPFEMAEIV